MKRYRMRHRKPPIKYPVAWGVASILLSALCGGVACSDRPTETTARVQQAVAVDASAVETLLSRYCSRCHGPESAGSGGIDYITNLGALVARGQVKPGRPDESRLLQRIERGEMPPSGRRPSEEETAVLRRWIAEGATPAAVGVVSYRAVEAAVLADLSSMPPERASAARYLSAHHLVGAGASELSRAGRSLAWIANSLSTQRRLVAPVLVRPDLGLYRVFLDDFGWARQSWELLNEVYPYVRIQGRAGRAPRPAPLDESAEGRAIASKTGSRLAIMRADWFAKRAATPPLYYDFLNIPSRLPDLERKLGISLVGDIQNGRVVRAGFSESGVSFHNRVIERHDLSTGAFWISYDFRSDEDRSNIFANPLGPGGAFGFEQAGGEVIFSLPNGLQAYMLVNNVGRRLDVGPLDIVADPNRLPSDIVNGFSCMGCHRSGILQKTNQVTRDSAPRVPAEYRNQIDQLYAPQDRLDAVYRGDSARVQSALATLDQMMGAGTGEAQNPFQTMADRYDSALDSASLAAEFGMTGAEWSTFARQVPDVTLREVVLPTVTNGVSIKREVVEKLFPDLLRFTAP